VSVRALYLDGGELCYRSDHEEPRPGPDEALIRVSVAGICATDLELARGYKGGFQGVPGHEFVGVVERAPDPAWQGRRVTASINVGCGRCARCLATGPEHCGDRAVIGILGRDGAFAEYVAAPLANLVAVPDALTDERAVFTEPLAAALRITEQLEAPPGRAAVIGPGRLGMLVGKVLSLAGTEVTMIGRSAASLALARAWGLAAASGQDAPRRGFDVVVDAAGNPAGFRLALDLVRPLGTVVVKSTFAGACDVDMSTIVVNEIRVIGSRCGPFAPALLLLARGQVDVDGLMGAEYRLEQGVAAFAHAARPGARKILLRP
jgi:threonine dehydrogenase-like Zn-dependent dehydrogenase